MQTNTSGYTGVTYNKADKVWRVTIYNEGKRIQLGSYKNIEDAITVRQEAEKKYYGEFRNIKGERINVQSCDVE
jgi:TATA-box binding protein (TBP) (component of TFIID and TFIIIB)